MAPRPARPGRLHVFGRGVPLGLAGEAGAVVAVPHSTLDVGVVGRAAFLRGRLDGCVEDVFAGIAQASPLGHAHEEGTNIGIRSGL